MTKLQLKSQALIIIKIKYWKASRSGNPPSLIPDLWNIGIFFYLQATRVKHFGPECSLQNSGFKEFANLLSTNNLNSEGLSAILYF